jgi:peptide/nickel transport system substrate-binding protein
MRTLARGSAVALTLLAAILFGPPARSQPAAASADVLVSRAEVGRTGGQLVIAQRAEPRTLNPVTAVDSPSLEVIGRTIGDLIHINRDTHQTEPALARSWTVSPDGRRYTLALRRGVRFSDGDPFDADDALFSFQVYLDEKIGSRNRDLLTVAGQPLTVRKIDQYTIELTIAEPYAVAERLFDSVAMLPRHLLESAYKEGRVAEAWGLTTPPSAIAGLGPFRFREYVPGQRIVLERNPYYWKVDSAGNQLPYLDRLVFLFVSGEDAQAVRFQSGEADVISRVSSANYAVLSREQRKSDYELFDSGAGLDYTFLFFNLNNLEGKGLTAISRKQSWFRRVPFRQAVSLAIDREAVVRLVYRQLATPLWGHVPPGNRLWVNRSLPQPARSLDKARELLRKGGFTWTPSGTLLDEKGQAVEFTVVTNTGNTERRQIATIIQDDLKQLGIRVSVVTLELRALLDRLLTTFDYDACVLGLGSGDADPNAEMNVMLSSGSTHLWSIGQSKPATSWEAEIDDRMQQQLTARDAQLRRRHYNRVQELVAEHLPLIPIVSPNVLVGAKKGLGNFRPTVLDHHALWNVEELFWRERRSGARQ